MRKEDDKRLGISTHLVKDPNLEANHAKAAQALAEIQNLLYLELENGSPIWNASKDVPCPEVISEIDEIMGRHGFHPTQGPSRRPFVHRPGKD